MRLNRPSIYARPNLIDALNALARFDVPYALYDALYISFSNKVWPKVCIFFCSKRPTWFGGKLDACVSLVDDMRKDKSQTHHTAHASNIITDT